MDETFIGTTQAALPSGASGEESPAPAPSGGAKVTPWEVEGTVDYDDHTGTGYLFQTCLPTFVPSFLIPPRLILIVVHAKLTKHTISKQT